MSTENSAKPRELFVIRSPDLSMYIAGKDKKELEDKYYEGFNPAYLFREVLTPDPRDEELEKLRDELNRAREDIAIYKSNSEDRAAANALLLKDRNKLRDDLKVAVEALESIASKHRDRHDTEEYWMKIKHEQCATVLATDTKIARNALSKISQPKEQGEGVKK